ncbi:hypothetical protein BCF11_3261 [Collimonas sp. PA-H2]|uniref:hypothetical protein n=1 Tax=Collimonas sp. PA-H2 TaxID=1881062 RepID=UPI000BF6EB60|nr:hypothetical protein [Collimonas sp. PA-H2]PFH10828.1 hypothetical protein BCF11_3261 [Collimonas sp. PA-H2]
MTKFTLQRGRAPLYFKYKQRGVGEEFLLLFIWAIVLIPVVVFGIALWFGKGYKGKILGCLIACVLTAPIFWPLGKAFYRDGKRNSLRTQAHSICVKELAQTPGPFLIDGFLDETGGLSSKDVQNFLTVGGMQFIEVKINESKSLLHQGDRRWPIARESGFAHLELGDASDNKCYVSPEKIPGPFFTSAPPVKPGTCLQVTYLEHPTARYAITSESGPNSSLTRWVLKDINNDVTIAGFTDAHRIDSPPHFNKGPDNDCQVAGIDGYSTLMKRIKPTPQALAKSAERIVSTESLWISGLPDSQFALFELRKEGKLPILRSTDGPYPGADEIKYGGRSWKEINVLAERHGAWAEERMLLNYRLDKLYQIEYEGLSGDWASTGKQLLFLTTKFANNNGSGPVVLDMFGVDFQGNALWSRELSPLSSLEGGLDSRFEPIMFELTDTDLLIHGKYGPNFEKKPWTIKVDLNQLNELAMARGG